MDRSTDSWRHIVLEKDAQLRPAAAEVEAALIEIARASQRAGERTETASDPSLPYSPAQPIHHSPARTTVGRERERVELREGFDSVAAGRGLVMCVAGGPGIGKTTIIEEFLAA